ncbi:MAG: LamG domain-containing protein [Candidatus Aenigmatarchaeota archaeon]
MDVTFIVSVSIFILFIALILTATINYFTRTPESTTVLELRDKVKNLFDIFFGTKGIITGERATTDLYRIPLMLEEKNGTNRTNEIVSLALDFDESCKKISWNNTVRVYDQQFVELPSRISYQEFCTSQWLNRSLITFVVNISANEKKRVYVYSINNSNTTAPNHSLDIKGYWTFDEGSGTLTKDFSGNQNNGTLTNFDFNASSGWFNGTDCKYGSCLKFDGVNDYVSVSNPVNIPIGNSPYTIALWFKADSNGVRGLVGWGNFGAWNQVNALRLWGDSCPNLGFRHYWWSNDLDVCTNYPAVGGWSHVAATFDGTTRRIYLNGTQIASDTPTGHNVPNANNFRIGSTNLGEYFNGTIDDVRIYDRALTADEIKSLANATPPTIKTFPIETITAISAEKVQELTGRNYQDIKTILGGDFDFRIEIREKQ